MTDVLNYRILGLEMILQMILDYELLQMILDYELLRLKPIVEGGIFRNITIA